MSENAAEATAPMDEAAILAELTPDAPLSAEAQAVDTETIAAEGTEQAKGEPAKTEGATEGEEAEAPLNLAKLEALAEQRRARRPEPKPEPEAKPEPLTAEAIAKAMQSANTQWQEAQKAYAEGDLAKLSQLMGGKDPASDFERFTRMSLDPDGTRAAATISKLEARIAELEGKGLPENVLTAEKLAEMRQQEEAAAYKKQSEAAFADLVKDSADTHPFLAGMDNAAALRYAYLAQGKLEAHAEATGATFTLADISRIAEQIASSELQGLKAHNQGAAPTSQGGSEAEKAASAATAGAKQASGGIDNRAASTTAATMPDPDDDDAWEQRARALALGS